MESNVQIGKLLIAIQGPTASGKTKLSIDLAKHFKTVVVSADSRQFYREMSIGTAKPDALEQDGIQHYFINSHAVEDELTAAQYAVQASEVLEKEFKIHDTIILVGGSGMFVDALLNGLDDIPTDLALRNQLKLEAENNGVEDLLKELFEKDPEFAKYIDKSNPSRIIRAVEAIRLTGKTHAEFRSGTTKNQPFEIVRFIIDVPRELLYDRINQRVDLMIENGLLDEAKALLPQRNLSSLKTVGYKELFDYFDGTITLDKAIELIKQHSRNYAKRQITWLKRYQDAKIVTFRSDMSSIVIQELSKYS
ncbi:MAG: tRNA (adenosine(37)-N6)-dimethylallyltransferase MiaA [Bacteroidota bacterium]